MARVFTGLVSSGDFLFGIEREGGSIIDLTGDVRYRFSITKPRTPSVLCGDFIESLQIAVLANYDGSLTAYDVHTGCIRWKCELERTVTRVVVLPSFGLVVAGDVTGAQCIHIEDGSCAKSLLNECSHLLRVKDGCISSSRSGTVYISGPKETLVSLEGAPDYVRKAMAVQGSLFVEFWRNEGRLFRYSAKTGKLEGVTEVEHCNFIHAVEDCGGSPRCRFLSAAADPKWSIVWEVDAVGNIGKVTTLNLGGHLWIFHKSGQLLISMHGRIIDVLGARVVQDEWKAPDNN